MTRFSAPEDFEPDDYYEPDADSYAEADDPYEAMIQESLAAIPIEAAKTYLKKYGDAIDDRLQACLGEAERLLRVGSAGPSLAVSLTTVEIMIRFLLLRPLLQGAFLSEQWAALLLRRIGTGRTAEDRKLLPAVLRNWGIDIEGFKTASGKRLWQFLTDTVWPARDRFAHAFDPVTEELAKEALAGAWAFRNDVIGQIAVRLEFTLDTTQRWSVIRRKDGGGETYGPTADPFDSPTHR